MNANFESHPYHTPTYPNLESLLNRIPTSQRPYISPTPPQTPEILDLGHKLILFSNYYVPFLN